MYATRQRSAIVSFSERRKIACYGYKASLHGHTSELVDFYRYGSFIPEESFDYSINDILIDGQYFKDFVMQSLKSLRKCDFQEYLLEAIVKAAYTNSFVESDYLTYYSALENLVNGFRKTQDFYFVLGEQDYKKFNNDIKKFISDYDLLKDGNNAEENLIRKKQRKLMYEKIPELNRVSFGTAFKFFCESYQIDIDDLWPLGGKVAPVSLDMIRNKIIHGERFEEGEYEALISAKMNLLWILERCILRVLNWDIDKSNVHSPHLKHYFAYTDWQRFSTILLKI